MHKPSPFLLSALLEIAGCMLSSAWPAPTQQPQLLTLSGKVLLADGSAPAHQIQVELVCNSRVIRVTQTRAEGSFHFRLGEQRRSTDISAGSSGADNLEIYNRGLGGLKAGGQLRTSGDGRYDLTNCEIKLAPRPGWESNTIPLGVQSVFELDIGVIVLREKSDARGTTVSTTTLQAPEAAQKAFRRAQKEIRGKRRYKRVKKSLEKAIKLYPEFAEAWNLMGMTHLETKDSARARAAFERAIAIDPNYIAPYLTLAGMELEGFHWKEALQWTEKLVSLDPSLAKGQYYHGLANYSLAHYDEALKALTAVDQGGDGEEFSAAYLMLGDILARKGRIPESAAKLRRFLEIGKHTPEMGNRVREQLQQWKEQGLIAKKEPQMNADNTRPAGTVTQKPPALTSHF